LSDEHGAGSLTALPIVETQEGDYAAYIPTNIISITDGQIYLERDLFFSGFRPAMNVGLSVSRVGGAAQRPAMKQVAGMLRLDLAYYQELQAFSQFATELDRTTRAQLARGERMMELLKQPQYVPMSMAEQVIVLYAGTHGYADEVEIEEVGDFGRELVAFVREGHPRVLQAIRDTGGLTEEVERDLQEAIEEYRARYRSKKSAAEQEAQSGTGAADK
jgi:F-type H+-transporting ATPase subunit alpha